MLTIRQMTVDDIPLGMRLKTQAGWNQLPGDWRRLIELEPTGCFVAQHDGQDVGTVTTTVFGDIAWIAMMLVDENIRGQGIGKALMNHALGYLDSRDVTSVRLDATPLGKPLYEKLGFEAQFEVKRYAGQPTPSPFKGEGWGEGQDAELKDNAAHHPHPNPLPSRESGPDVQAPIDRMVAFDRAVTRTPREKLLRRLFDEFPDALHARADGSYVTWRPGEHAVQIGPCIGDDDRLLRHALACNAGKQVYVDVPAHRCVEGLTAQRTLTRMTRGRMIVEDTEKLRASSGPEKG